MPSTLILLMLRDIEFSFKLRASDVFSTLNITQLSLLILRERHDVFFLLMMRKEDASWVCKQNFGVGASPSTGVGEDQWRFVVGVLYCTRGWLDLKSDCEGMGEKSDYGEPRNSYRDRAVRKSFDHCVIQIGIKHAIFVAKENSNLVAMAFLKLSLLSSNFSYTPINSLCNEHKREPGRKRERAALLPFAHLPMS